MRFLMVAAALVVAAGCGGGSEPAAKDPARSPAVQGVSPSPSPSSTADELADTCDRVALALPADSYDTDAMAAFMTDLAGIANDASPETRSELVGLVGPLNSYVSGGGPDAHRAFLQALDQLAGACAAPGSNALQ